MTSSRITSKGRITIPIKVRNELKINLGDRLLLVLIEPGRYELEVAKRDVTALKGMFGAVIKRTSIQDMNETIARRGLDQFKFE
jgi:AbrB family looped-hinge helix DNA binding protein